MAAIYEGTSRVDGEHSDISGSTLDVVSEEDLQMQELIREEKRVLAGKPPKRVKKQKQTRKSRRDKDSSDEGADRVLRMAEKAINEQMCEARQKSSSEFDEYSETAAAECSEIVTKDVRVERGMRGRNKSSALRSTTSNYFMERLNKIESTIENDLAENSTVGNRKFNNSSGKSELSSNEEDNSVSHRKLSNDEKKLANLVSSARKLLSSSRSEESSPSHSEGIVHSINKTKRKRRRKVSSDSEPIVEETSGSDESGSSATDDDEIVITKPTTKRLKVVAEDSDDEVKVDEGNIKRSRAPKAILGKDKLQQETLEAEKAEKERRKRLEQKQKEFNGIEMMEGVDIASALVGGSNVIQKLKVFFV
ncbi:hypothetical protein DICVIV_04281 [Dictyocaulus viviparus]|uniref:Uncharacterized protein n=1 Tax=Dictyocaulus viviparus TaxID=29172 RepID=A0A0D8XYH7_DICVI|nr:hypothetical protein DICVIV_04281 [Dictyocaulus viviparus]